MGGRRIILVWVLMGSGFVGLLNIREEPVMDANDTDLESDSEGHGEGEPDVGGFSC